MKEYGLVNRNLSKIIAEQGHQDLLLVADAGFAIPVGVDIVDLSLKENNPMVLDVVTEIQKYHSVEKLIFAQQTVKTNPKLFNDLKNVWNRNIEVEIIDHLELKQLAKSVKAIIRTGDFTAYGNVILVSGAGDRWYCENDV